MVKYVCAFVCATASLSIGGCQREVSSPIEENAVANSIGVEQFSADDLQRMGIVVEPVRRETIAATKAVVGWLEAVPAAQHVVRAPVTGFVVASADHDWPELGQSITADEKIAKVNVFLTPQEVSQLVIAKEDNDAQMQQALATMELSEAQLKHVLAARDAVTGVRIDQLKESLAHSRAAYNEAQDKLPYLIKEPSADGLLVKPLDIESVISGRILQVHIAEGQFVVSGDPLWTVADWSKLWIRVPLFEADARRVDHGTSATVRDRTTGSIKPATPLTIPTQSKPVTRTIDYYYEIDNSDWGLRVGQSTSVELPIGERREVVQIPRSALLFNAFGQPSCYVTEADSTAFARRQIELGVRFDDYVEVTRGLDADDRVVSIGAEQLSAEESKADLAVEDDD